MPQDAYRKLLKVPLKYLDSKQNVKEFHTQIFIDLKDLSPMLACAEEPS